MSSPSAKSKSKHQNGSGGGGKQAGSASRTSALSTCGTEVAHKHGLGTTTSTSGTLSNGSNLEATGYSVARYLASQERHEKVAQGITSGSDGPRRADSGPGGKI